MVLDQAIDDATTKLGNLFQDKSAFHEAMEKSRHEFDTLRDRSGENWSSLNGVLQNFHTQVSHDEWTLAADTRDAVAEVEKTRETLSQILQILDTDMDMAEAAIQDNIQLLEDLDRQWESGFHQFQQTVDGLDQMAQQVQQEITSEAHRISDILDQQVTAELEQYRVHADTRIAALDKSIQDQHIPRMTQMTQGLIDHLSQVLGQLETHFKSRSDEASHHSEATLDQVHVSVDTESLNSLMLTAKDVQSRLETIGDNISGLTHTVDDAKEGVEAGINMATVGIHTVIGIIDEVGKLFEHILGRHEK